MPALSAHQSSHTTKMLLVGNPGAGKTGALASLASAGYNLRVIDMDNGLDVLANLLRDPRAKYDPASLGRVVFETITDPMKKVGKVLVPSQPKAWDRAIGLLQNWKTSTEDLGPVVEWTPNEVLVIDGLTHFCQAAMNAVLAMNARLGQRPQLADWGTAQAMVEGVLQTLYDDSIVCNVVVNCHITFVGEENGPSYGYPACLGKALPPKVGSYFNTILGVRTTGTGANEKRKIVTQTFGNIGLKTSAPHAVAPEYPIETGLADYFKAVRQASPASA